MTFEIPLLTKLQDEYEKQKAQRALSESASWQNGWVPFNGVTPWNASFWELDPSKEPSIEALPPTPLAELQLAKDSAQLERSPIHDVFMRQEEPVVVSDPALQEERWVDDFLRYWF